MSVFPRRALMRTSPSTRLGAPKRPAAKNGTEAPLVGTCKVTVLVNGPEVPLRNLTRPPPAVDVPLRRMFTVALDVPAGFVTLIRHGDGTHDR